MSTLGRLKCLDEIYKKNAHLVSFFISYLDYDKVNPPLVERLNSQEILDTKGNFGMSFWQSALSKQHEIILTDAELVKAVTHHNGPGSDSIEIVGPDIYQAISDIIKKKGEGISINILSRVKTNGGDFGYLPIIDFRLKQSSSNLESVSNICEIIGLKLGFNLHLFESSTSYHAYGDRILTLNEYFNFLGWALLFDPLVDGRHIAHQMIDGYGALRIA